MRRIIVIAVLLFVVFPYTAQAEIIGFDDLGSLLSGGYYNDPFHPNGFQTGGFQFDMFLMDESIYQGSMQNSSGYPSSPIAAYIDDASSSDNPHDLVTVSSLDGSLFNFIGADFGGYTIWDTVAYFAATELTIEGFADGNLVSSVTFCPLNIGFQFVEVNISGVDTLVFSAASGPFSYSSHGFTGVVGSGTYWMMDNFEYNTAVPEPSMLLLLGFSLAGLFLVRRRLSFQPEAE